MSLQIALKEAYASVPSDEVILHTLEIRHPNFTTPLRVVKDWQDLTAKLEVDAPVNAGEYVTFLGLAFEFVPPSSTTQASPEVQITLDNVSREIGLALESAIESMQKISLTYRPYLLSDLSMPQMSPPLNMTVMSGSINMLRATLRAGFSDFANMRFPSQVYTAARFPGLVR